MASQVAQAAVAREMVHHQVVQEIRVHILQSKVMQAVDLIAQHLNMAQVVAADRLP
jgi:hypothetical protein